MTQTTASRLLVSARRSSGLTQRELARRARTSQSVIARIESGAASPSWKTLQRLVNRAGFDLQGLLSPRRNLGGIRCGIGAPHGPMALAGSMVDFAHTASACVGRCTCPFRPLALAPR